MQPTAKQYAIGVLLHASEQPNVKGLTKTTLESPGSDNHQALFTLFMLGLMHTHDNGITHSCLGHL